jgi:hypothetical protein
MADISSADRKAIAKSVAEALSSEAAPPAAMMAALPAAATANPKQFFCQNWLTVKSVLQVAQTLAPPLVRPVIGIVITVGDGIAKVICP